MGETGERLSHLFRTWRELRGDRRHPENNPYQLSRPVQFLPRNDGDKDRNADRQFQDTNVAAVYARLINAPAVAFEVQRRGESASNEYTDYAAIFSFQNTEEITALLYMAYPLRKELLRSLSSRNTPLYKYPVIIKDHWKDLKSNTSLWLPGYRLAL